MGQSGPNEGVSRWQQETPETAPTPIYRHTPDAPGLQNPLVESPETLVSNPPHCPRLRGEALLRDRDGRTPSEPGGGDEPLDNHHVIQQAPNLVSPPSQQGAEEHLANPQD